MSHCPRPFEFNDRYPAFFAAHAVLSSVSFGVGIVGNLVALIVFNRSALRQENATYAYLTGLAIVDLLTLVSATPEIVHNIELLPYDMLHSHSVTQCRNVTLSVGYLSKYAANWFVALTPCVARGSKRRLRRISVNRLIIFIAAMMCAMLCLPRFFAVKVAPVCQHTTSVWRLQATSFGRWYGYTDVYPWMALAVGTYLPTVLAVCTAFSLAYNTPSNSGRRVLVTPRNETARRDQLSASVLVIVTVSLTLGAAETLALSIEAIFGQRARDNHMFVKYRLLAELLTHTSVSMRVLIYILFDGYFRKILRRTFCCLCQDADEYYEPMTWRSFFRIGDSATLSGAITASREEKLNDGISISQWL